MQPPAIETLTGGAGRSPTHAVKDVVTPAADSSKCTLGVVHGPPKLVAPSTQGARARPLLVRA